MQVILQNMTYKRQISYNILQAPNLEVEPGVDLLSHL